VDPTPYPSYHYIVGEVASALAIVGAFFAYLPALATLLAILWYVILIIESRTGAALLARIRIKREAATQRSVVKEHALLAAETIKEQATIAAETLRDNGGSP
jgi:hypothetical protein